jgi:hypothetical protein
VVPGREAAGDAALGQPGEVEAGPGRAGADARGVHERVAHRDRPRRRDQLAGAVGALDPDLHVPPLGQVAVDRVGELAPSLLVQRQQGDPGHRLGHRVQAPDAVVGHGGAPLDVHAAERAAVGDVAVPGHEDLAAGDLARLHVPLAQVPIDAGETVGIEAGGHGLEAGRREGRRHWPIEYRSNRSAAGGVP